MASPKTLTIQYIDLFSHLTAQLPNGCKHNKFSDSITSTFIHLKPVIQYYQVLKADHSNAWLKHFWDSYVTQELSVTSQIHVSTALATCSIHPFTRLSCKYFFVENITWEKPLIQHIQDHSKAAYMKNRCFNLPSVELSQKHELAVCRPAPFFCMMIQVTVGKHKNTLSIF